MYNLYSVQCKVCTAPDPAEEVVAVSVGEGPAVSQQGPVQLPSLPHL